MPAVSRQLDTKNFLAMMGEGGHGGRHYHYGDMMVLNMVVDMEGDIMVDMMRDMVVDMVGLHDGVHDTLFYKFMLFYKFTLLPFTLLRFLPFD